MPRRRLPAEHYCIATQGYASLRETLVRQDAISFEIGFFENQPGVNDLDQVIIQQPRASRHCSRVIDALYLNRRYRPRPAEAHR